MRVKSAFQIELVNKERRLDKAISWVERNRHTIHPSISFIQAIELYDMGIDVAQIKPEQPDTN
jgi:hypothetical protein